ncbi:MAG: hypothetical protein FJ100_23265 [Deltaproteobacteria bacterium]|nr:hypothetical protein [Deltaproteobacteria bacterium]
MTIADRIHAEVQALPEVAAREVLDFVQFLRLKHDPDGLVALKMAQLPAMAAIWDNDLDDVWNDD